MNKVGFGTNRTTRKNHRIFWFPSIKSNDLFQKISTESFVLLWNVSISVQYTETQSFAIFQCLSNNHFLERLQIDDALWMTNDTLVHLFFYPWHGIHGRLLHLLYSNEHSQNKALQISDKFSKMPSYQQLVMAVYGNWNAKFTIAIVLNSILYRWHVDSRWMLFRKFFKHLTHPQLLYLKCN